MYGIVYQVNGRDVYLTRKNGTVVTFHPSQLGKAEEVASALRAHLLIDVRVVKL